jgi:hypothetical protein
MVATQEIAQTLKALIEDLSTDEQQQMLKVLQQYALPEERESDLPLARKLVGRSFSRQERIQLELDSLFSYFEQRRNLLARSLTAPEVAKLLGTSRQTPHDRLKNQTLLGILDRGAYRFPIWQFDAEGTDGVIEGLSEVLRALKVSDWDKLSWLVHPNPILDGLTPVEALKKGKKEQVVEEAVGIGVL